ncbi:MAG TPA: CAP domain-containing protein [Leptospiraceae bacterium]|nr:CAP domain-containing protein [Leptospiraceae bacterium]HMW06012.1 CAP domain-containing protein [Leptospiraceae bacterium]HMX32790.1 CAP domain-containing protein [Leptospiraceae bacterium]HMY31446.1 CAP domain-containing protein [Leptospiraceae bacterium]HMZ67428.1 CAP domain-containing protein [Leptospiraceae bacterium]
MYLPRKLLTRSLFVLLFSLLISTHLFSFGRNEAKKAFDAVRDAIKLYVYCKDCGDLKARVLFINERGVEPIIKDKQVDYQFFVNKKQYLNIHDIYFQKNNQWINLGIYSGIQNSTIPYELPADKMPFDLEAESEKNFKTPSDIFPLTIFEKQILEELNKVRTSPKEYAKSLRERIPFYENNIYYPLDRRPYQTKEGIKGLEEAIANLELAQPRSPLRISAEISSALQNYFKSNFSYSSHWRELRDRYGKYIQDPELINIVESQVFGFNNPSDLVAYLLSMNTRKKGEFKNSIFDTDINYLGLACRNDSTYTYMCHLTLAEDIIPNVEMQEYQKDRNKKSNYNYLSEFEYKVIEETNLLRTKPREYAEIIKRRRVNYFDKIYKEISRSPITVEEGISALEEAIRFLEKVTPLSELTPNEELTLSAKDHVLDTGSKGITGHYGSSGSSPVNRIQKYKKEYKIVGENIYYGTVDPRDVVISLLVDDGVSNRGHRANLFHKDFNYIGVSCGYHRDFPLMCVQNFGNW